MREDEKDKGAEWHQVGYLPLLTYNPRLRDLFVNVMVGMSWYESLGKMGHDN